jgi:phosphoglycerol transferase MdoB-like AlkP superfamily enzyme
LPEGLEERELGEIRRAYRHLYLSALGIIGVAMILMLIGMRLSSIWLLIISLVLVIVSFAIIMRANLYRFAYAYAKKHTTK